jgi:outer membrane immunogenic protein
MPNSSISPSAVIAAAACATVLGATPAIADSGFYIGAGIGASSVQADIQPVDDIDLVDIKENDVAWKAFAGYNIDLPVIDVAVEGGYVNLGKPSINSADTNVSLDTSGWDAFAIGAFNIGPAAVFAKLGVVAWDVKVNADGINLGDDDGTDLAYGVGARFGVGALQVRGEAEFFEINVIDSSYLLSASVVWQF